MRKTLFKTLLLLACPLAFAQNNAHPAGSLVPSAMDKVRAEYSQNLTPGTTIEFYCLIESVEHPRAGTVIICKRPVGVYSMTWGMGDYDAYAKATSALAPKDIIRAQCKVGPIQSSDQIDLACGPPVKVKR